jgi:hypothetical protein
MNSGINYESNSDSISNKFSNKNENQFSNQFWNHFWNKFQNKFGIDSVKKGAEFEQKYPIIFNGILLALIQEYMEKNPEVLEQIYGRFLEIIGEKFDQ